MFEKIKKWYTMGLWKESMVKDAISKGVLTKEEVDKILKK